MEQTKVIELIPSITKQDDITQVLTYTARVQKYENDTWIETTELNETQLAQKIIDISLYKSQNDWPFDEVFYINNKYITLVMDGACFIFFNSNKNKKTTNISNQKIHRIGHKIYFL